MLRNSLFIIYLAALAAFAPFSTDSYLASMPIIQKLFATTAAKTQLTLSFFFITIAVAPLLWGPLSDRFGRKKITAAGLLIFILGSVLCAVSTNITSLILSRILQACGACSGIVMSIAMVKDHYSDHQHISKTIARMMAAAMLAPIIAPIIGSYLLVHINWQANFYFLAAYGLILLILLPLIKETHPKHQRKPTPAHKLLSLYWQQIKCRPFLLGVVATSTNFAVLFSFISTSSFIFIDIYHIPTQYFGYLFAFNACALIAGNLLVGKLKQRFAFQKTLIAAAMLIIIAAIIMYACIQLFPSSFLAVTLPTLVVSFGIGLLYPEVMALAMQNVVSHAGLASSLLGTGRFGLAAIVGAVAGGFISSTALPLAVSMTCFSVLTLISLLIYFRRARSHSAE